MVTRTISNASLNTKLIAFSAIVRSLFEYACQVWLPYIEFLIEKIETVQSREEVSDGFSD